MKKLREFSYNLQINQLGLLNQIQYYLIIRIFTFFILLLALNFIILIKCIGLFDYFLTFIIVFIVITMLRITIHQILTTRSTISLFVARYFFYSYLFYLKFRDYYKFNYPY